MITCDWSSDVCSSDLPVMPGRISTIRTAKNVSGLPQRYDAQTTAPAGSTISVLPRTFALDPGESVELTITIESTAADGQYFGEVRLDPRRDGYPTLHLPVAFRTGQAQVTLASSCSPLTIPSGGISTCDVTATNTSFNDTTVSLRTTVSNNLRVASASGAFIVNNRTVEKPDVALAGGSPGVPTVDPGASPAGYIPLDAFGVTPDPIGDEEIINYAVPAFVSNGVTYSSIGVDSNGYIIAGGGTAEDNNCCNLPAGSDPAPPNNMLAPFWTNLDGTGAPGILAAVLTDGANSWLVIEYRVNVADTNSGRVFQVWIGVDGAQDISYAYDPANLPGDPNGQDFLVGAENVLGQGDVSRFLPTADQRVTSTPPTPGASVSYTVNVSGVDLGVGTVRTEMTGRDLPGTTIVTTEVTVNARRSGGGPV
jgi:hypothetical protein